MDNNEAYKAVRWALEVSLFYDDASIIKLPTEFRQATDTS